MKLKRLKKRFPWILLGIYWPMLFVATHIPRMPDFKFPNSDKILHFSAYMVLALVFWLAKFGTSRPDPRRGRIYKILLLFALYAMLDEITQKFVGRTCDVRDWMADMAGVCTAMVVLFALRRWWHWLSGYWLIMFLVSHLPGDKSFLARLPDYLQRYQDAYILAGYTGLTMLWWRTISPVDRFAFSRSILTVTVLFLPVYAFIDETTCWVMGRGFDTRDFISALCGITLGIICSFCLAQHNEVNERIGISHDKQIGQNHIG